MDPMTFYAFILIEKKSLLYSIEYIFSRPKAPEKASMFKLPQKHSQTNVVCYGKVLNYISVMQIDRPKCWVYAEDENTK